jgi:hypothetical protein
MKRPQRFRVNMFLSSLLALLFVLHGTVRAQLTTGDLQFRVVDSLAQPIAGVNAVVTGTNVQGVDANGVPTNPNPTYGQAYRYQPPMSVRVGMEVNF